MLFLLIFRSRLARLIQLFGRRRPRSQAPRPAEQFRFPDGPATAEAGGQIRPGTPRSCVPVLLNVAEGHWAPVLMELRYEREDPYAVELAFYVPDGCLALWRFSRDLLLAGLDGSVGEGEVAIWPSEETGAGRALFLQLGSDESHALLAVRRSPVSWLAHTFMTVPMGREMAEVDWGEEQRQLFRGV
ncbi:SsgA family sporulation/cell division regulator [Streptomyces rubiginosohelvolus]|uniref:SsgA family sporulation/cell division regulator n=1 Tax=Streptomyces rubiginosohelvolus TaxID=67362 RepID=UPI0035DACDD7